MLRLERLIRVGDGAFAERPAFHAEFVHQRRYLIAGFQESLLAATVHRRQAQIKHERILQFRAREAQVAEVIQHHARRSGVDDIAQAKVSDTVKERENVRAGLLRAHDNDAVVLLDVVRQDGHHHISVQRVEVARRLVQQDDNRIT